MTPSKIKLLKWIAFIFATSLTLTTIFVLPRFQRKIPAIPDDKIHTKILKIEECIQCHVKTTEKPLPKNHAAKQQCLYCHKYPQ
ncbi:MAG: hypothetical protein HZA08_01940 [Nitrospirae bacterium]|nr:hypothetical protein [Nitrospirota bacterium]